MLSFPFGMPCLFFWCELLISGRPFFFLVLGLPESVKFFMLHIPSILLDDCQYRFNRTGPAGTPKWPYFWQSDAYHFAMWPLIVVDFTLTSKGSGFYSKFQETRNHPHSLEKLCIWYIHYYYHATIHPSSVDMKLEAARELWENADLYCGTTTRWEIQMTRKMDFCRDGFFWGRWKDQVLLFILNGKVFNLKSFWYNLVTWLSL